MHNYYNPEENNEPEIYEEPAIEEEEAPAAAPRTKSPRQKTPKQPPKPSPKKPKKNPAPAKPFIGSPWAIFLAFALLTVTALVGVALISCFFNSGADQVKVQYDTLGHIVSTGGVKNTIGPVGARIGEWLLTGSLGIGSFVLVVWAACVGLWIGGWIKLRFWSFTLKCLVLSVSISIIAGLLTMGAASPIRYGGHHGHYVNRLLIDYTSVFGAIGVSLVLAALLVVIFGASIARIWRNGRDTLGNIKLPKPSAPIAKPEPEEEPEETEETEESDQTEEPEQSDLSDRSDLSDLSDEEFEAPALDEELEVEVGEIEEAESVSTKAYDPTADLSHFHFPSIDLLEDRQGGGVTVDMEEQEANKQRIIKALEQFDIQIQSIKATVGPTITLFEVVPAPGQRIAAIKRVEEDLALALKALGIRIIAPIPGKGTIGIEVPNNDPQVVSMRSVIASKKFQECKYELPMAMGATISNEVFIADLTKMPHLLVAGATGQGKSVGLNAIITSLLYKKHPAELKFVLIDPKMVEFSLYRTLERHYLAKLPDEEDAVITDMNKVVTTLNSLCVLMDQRYTLLSQAGCRGIKEYNQKFIARRLNPEKGHHFMPYIVVVVDEFADLIMTAGKEVEAPICRLAQKARAVGIHVIIATQRPSTNVITGLIKANFPGRIAFRVSQMVDSKTILDRTGAHQLVGKGDMFFSTNGNLERVQCAFIDTPEVESICECISEQQGYPSAYELPDYQPEVMGDGGGVARGNGDPGDRDPLLEESARFLVSAGNTASTSSLQRRYSIGYNRAGKIMDQLEAIGVVGPANGAKPRQILVDPMDLDQMFG